MRISKRFTAICSAFLAAALIATAAPAVFAAFGDGAVLPVFAKSGREGAPVVFSAEDFESRLIGRDRLVSVKVSSLPSGGALRLAGKDVTPGQSIPVDMLSALTYTPRGDEETHDSFTVLPVFKKGGEAETPTRISVNLQSEDTAAPVAVDLWFETYPDLAINDRLAAGVTDGEHSFVLLTMPKKGTVELEGEMFKYTPSGKSGKDSFTYMAVDKNGRASDPAKVEIRIVKRPSGSGVFYTDLENSSAAYAAVKLSEAGIISGEQIGADRFFHPEREVSRGEFIAMMTTLAELPAPAAAVSTGLSDNDTMPAWMRPYILTAMSCGLVKGFSDGSGGREIKAEAPITRAEAAVMLNKVLALTDDPRTEELGDVPEWARAALANTLHAGVLSRGADGTANYSAPVTREDCANMLYRAMLILRGNNSGLFGIFK